MSEVDFDLLDSNVEDLADLKKFEPFPAGAYKLAVKWEKKEVNGRPAVSLVLECLEVGELSDTSAKAPEVGTTTNILMQLKMKDGGRNEIGEGQLKQVIAELAPTFGTDGLKSKISQVMEASNGAVILATLKVRTNKDDPDQKYNSIKTCQLAA